MRDFDIAVTGPCHAILELIFTGTNEPAEISAGGKDLAEVAGLYDFLDEDIQEYLATALLERLQTDLDNSKPFDRATQNILELADPYLANSSLCEATIDILSHAFQPEAWPSRPFNDNLHLGFALIECADVEDKILPVKLWHEFYETYKSDELSRYDAFDTAIAGLASHNVVEFAKIFNGEEFEADFIYSRWSAYMPTLVRLNSYDEMETAISKIEKFIPQEDTARLRKMLKASCNNQTTASQISSAAIQHTP